MSEQNDSICGVYKAAARVCTMYALRCCFMYENFGGTKTTYRSTLWVRKGCTRTTRAKDGAKTQGGYLLLNIYGLDLWALLGMFINSH